MSVPRTLCGRDVRDPSRTEPRHSKSVHLGSILQVADHDFGGKRFMHWTLMRNLM
jgi:hypothetical protein